MWQQFLSSLSPGDTELYMLKWVWKWHHPDRAGCKSSPSELSAVGRDLKVLRRQGLLVLLGNRKKGCTLYLNIDKEKIILLRREYSTFIRLKWKVLLSEIFVLKVSYCT